MPTDVQQLVDDVLAEGNFDATSEQALRWLTRRHRTMVVRARLYRRTVEIGPTVAGQRTYQLPVGLVEIFEVLVGGRTYGTGRHTDLAAGAQGWLWLSDDGGITSEDETTDGLPAIALYPTPTEAVSLQVRAAFVPAEDLDVADDRTLLVPDHFHDALVSGAIATGLKRMEARPDLAAQPEAEFDAACEELRRQMQRRYRGPGAAQIRVRGVNV